MMYKRDAYESGRIFVTAEQKQAVEEGKKFAQRAYADIWARDPALVRRVRSFLGQNFYWHQRLSTQGADLEVVQTLQSMIRGESVVLVAEQSRTAGASSSTPPRAQKLPTFRESLMTGQGMSYDAATDYIDWYNDMVDRVNARAARVPNVASSSLADQAGDVAGTVTPFGDAQLFDYTPDAVSGDVDELAARTTNPDYAAKMLGYDRDTFGDMIHDMKDGLGLGGADNVIWHDDGKIEFKGKVIGNMHDY